MGRVFLVYGTPLTAFPLLKYLGQTLPYPKNGWPEVEQNLCRARGKWGHLENILGR